jgi:hypothetical protein
MKMSLVTLWFVKGSSVATDTLNSLPMLKLYEESQQEPVMRQKNMIMNPAGPKTKNDCAGEANSSLPNLTQRGAIKHEHITENPHCWRP